MCKSKLDDELIWDVYRNSDNYCVKELNSKSNKCLILFSSNGLYYPNTNEVFLDVVMKNDKYDFVNVTRNRRTEKEFGRIIFVRDVWKAWYVRGINKELDTIDKVINRLKQLTSGYEVVTAGSSAGGYMAMVAGIALGASKVLNFAGQVNLTEIDNRLLREYATDSSRNIYYNIEDRILNAQTPIIHFYAIHSEHDKKHYNKIKAAECVVPVAFAYDTHAKTVLPVNYKYLFDMDVEQFKEHSKKVWTEFSYLICTGGVAGLLSYGNLLVRRIGKRFK